MELSFLKGWELHSFHGVAWGRVAQWAKSWDFGAPGHGERSGPRGASVPPRLRGAALAAGRRGFLWRPAGAFGAARPGLGERCAMGYCGWFVKTNQISFWLVGEFTTHFRSYFSGDWDHWGYDLAFDPWPYPTRGRGE